MDIFKQIFLFLSAALLAAAACSCARTSDGEGSYEKSVSDGDPGVSDVSSGGGAENETLTVTAISYKDEKLTFEYDGETKTLPLSADSFENDDMNIVSSRLCSEQIINNVLGETVSAKITLDGTGDEIISCNVIDLNGEKVYSQTLDSGSSAEESELVYRFRHIGGSVYELYNCERSISADLNELSDIDKGNFPEECGDVMFEGYMFSDGNFIINFITFLTSEEDNEKSYSTLTSEAYVKFFGTVCELDGDSAEILLNDGATVCAVPSYFCCGELEVGAEVMVSLNADKSLFGSGESKSFGYAVICTDPDEYNSYGYDFDTLEYAVCDTNTAGRLIYTRSQ